MSEPRFACICNDPSKEAPQTQCVMCNLFVHPECYGYPRDRSFYCEPCLLNMYDPLIATSDTLKCEPLLDNTDKRMGLRNIELQLNQKQVQELESGMTFLNLFVIQKGHLTPTFDNLQVMIDRASFSLNTERYNLISTQKLDLSYSGQKKGCTIKIKVFLNEPDINGKLNITLANKVDPDHLYEFLTVQREASQLKDAIPLEYCWSSMINKSKNTGDTSVFSLLDPITLLLMKRPGKGVFCTHTGFFCLESYIKLNLQMKDREKQWCCPICKKRLFYQELFWDDQLQTDLDLYRQNNKLALESSSSGSSDHDLEPKKVLEGSQTELPKFKLYLHKGKVCTAAEIVKLAPWVLKQPQPSGSKQENRSVSKTPPKSARKQEAQKASKTRPAAPETSEEPFLLKKRKPNPLQSLVASKPTKKALEQVSSVQKQNTKQSLDKSRINPEQHGQTESQMREQSNQKSRNSLAIRTGSRRKGQPADQILSPTNDHLDHTQGENPPSTTQAAPIKLRDDDSFEFLSDSSDTNKVHQGAANSSILGSAAQEKIQDQSGELSKAAKRSVLEMIQSQEPFKIVRDESEPFGKNKDGQLDISLLSGAVHRSIGGSQNRKQPSTSTPHAAPALSPPLPLKTPPPSTSRASQPPPARPRSVLKPATPNPKHTRPQLNLSVPRATTATTNGTTKTQRSSSTRRVQTAGHSLLEEEVNGGRKRMRGERGVGGDKRLLVAENREDAGWVDARGFGVEVGRWVRRAEGVLGVLDGSGGQELAEGKLQNIAGRIAKSCLAGPKEEFHHAILMQALLGGVSLGYEGVGYLLGEVCALINPDKTLPLIVSYLQLFTIKRYGVSETELLAMTSHQQVKWMDQNQGREQELSSGWLPVQQLTDLMFGILKSFMRQQKKSDPQITLNDFLEVSCRLIASFLAVYTHQHMDGSLDRKAGQSGSESATEQVSSWIIDNFSRKLSSVLHDSESPPDTQKASKLERRLGDTLKSRLDQSLALREGLPAPQ